MKSRESKIPSSIKSIFSIVLRISSPLFHKRNYKFYFNKFFVHKNFLKFYIDTNLKVNFYKFSKIYFYFKLYIFNKLYYKPLNENNVFIFPPNEEISRR